MNPYDPGAIEKKWQEEWEKSGIYKAADNDATRKKFYALIEFPYPSGAGLHTGHIRSNTAMDIIVRKRRMEGQNVLYPIGWDAFGLPTENYAIKTGIHPREVTKQNTDTFRRQLKSLGFSFDWSREIDTTDPAYYKWTQWIFLQMFKHGLAYKAKMPINWCLSCKIGLANEEVVDGKCERCGGATEKREKEQWMLAITKYADRLDKDLDDVDYLEKIKIQQRNWIGKSEGAIIKFKIQNSKGKSASENVKVGEVEVFTTRPDTLFGCTYCVLAPEHSLVETLKDGIKNWDEVVRYIVQSKSKSEMERTAEGKEKTGVELKGIKAVNPANGEEVPIFIADYVLAHYGTGAIMAVPAHDERDWEFAEKFNLPKLRVVEPYFIKNDGEDGVRDDKQTIEREAITTIVKHWTEDKYIVLKWKKIAWHTFITGGVENGQTPEEAAHAEVFEETGYRDIKSVSELSKFHAKFFHVPKDENRLAHFHTFYFELGSGEREVVSDDEQKRHEVLWLTPDEIAKVLTPPGHLYVWNELKNGASAYLGGGILANSEKFDGMDSETAKWAITEFVGGEMKTTYKLRDWVFSRQRYWGEPIPIIHCEKCGAMPVSEKDLPVTLPDVEKYEPTDTGESPLAAITDWVNTKCPSCGGDAKRETDTMPNWAGSSWYFLRYLDPKNETALADAEKIKYWLPVNWYNGGMEHTTLHLLYSRFWHKFLYDVGVVPAHEPYAKRTSHGMILAEGGVKMSKSKGNVVNPDDIIARYGADTLRVYEMFMGPFDQSVAWSEESIVGARRFLEKVWRLAPIHTDRKENAGVADKKIETLLHKTIKKVGEDIEAMNFNTAISAMMIFVNEAEKTGIAMAQFEAFLKILAPFAPHIAEELWRELGHTASIHTEPFPAVDLALLQDEEKTIAVQIDGKTRDAFTVIATTDDTTIEKMALERENVKRWLNGKEIRRVMVAKGKIVSVVCKP